MWSLPLEKIEPLLASHGPMPRVAIETGTCRGNGTRLLARRFARVFTIELSRELHELARERLKSDGVEHVELLHGDSAALLPGILRSLPPSDAVFFFLDAHWSGDRSVDWSRAGWKGYGTDTAHLGGAGRPPSGPEQVPLARELAAIVDHCAGRAIVLIDDLKNLPPRGPGFKDREFPGEDWSHLSRELLLSIARPRLVDSRELNDPSQWLLILGPRP